MSLRILALTNLFPSAWDPRRAAYNRQQFTRLGRLDQVSVMTAVELPVRLRRRRGDAGLGSFDARDFTFVYPPGILRSWQPALWLASLLVQHGRWLRCTQFDCLLASWAFPDAVAVARLARRLDRPYAVKVHGNDINVMSRDPVRADAIRATLRGAGAVIAVSRALAEAVVALGVERQRVHLIYNGVDADSFKPGPRGEARRRVAAPGEGPRILFVGNLKGSKGCLDLVDALPAVLRALPHAVAVFVGNGPDRAALVRRIESLGLDRQAVLAGEVAHDTLPDQYRAADVVCLPSHNEGVPNVLLEAMACGVPVVATRVGGIPEVVPSEAGIMVPPRDRVALAAALCEALTRDWDHRAIRAHAEKFRWDDNVGMLHDVLADMVSRSSRRGALAT